MLVFIICTPVHTSNPEVIYTVLQVDVLILIHPFKGILFLYGLPRQC